MKKINKGVLIAPLAVALMLVLDCSMSMSQQSTYLQVAKQGAIKCVEAMSDNDYVGVVSFNRSAYLKSSLIEANETNKASLTRIISGLTTSQGTYYTEALEMAHEELLKSNAAVKHIIFLSDGQPSDRGYSEAVSNAAKDGITVSTIGLGYSSSILESMAESGSGRYYYVSSASDPPNIMLSETEQEMIGDWEGYWYPEYLPEGFYLAEAEETKFSKAMLFVSNGSDATIVITNDKSGTQYSFDTDTTLIEPLEVGYYEGYYFCDEQNNHSYAIWQTEDMIITVSCENMIDKSQIISIAENMKYVD